MIRLFLGVGLGVSTIALATFETGVSTFVHLPSLALVLLFTAAVLYLKFGTSFYRGLFLEKEFNQDIIETASIACLLAGFLGTLFGLVTVLANLDSPERIGPGLALAVTSLIYSIVLYALLILPKNRTPGLFKRHLGLPAASMFLIGIQVALTFLSLNSTGG